MSTATEPHAEHYECTAAEYHADKSRTSNSMLSDFIEHPLLYHGRHVVGRWPRKEKPYLLKGIAVHEDVLLPGKLEATVVEIPEDVLSAGGSRAGGRWKDFAAENAGKALLKAAEMVQVAEIVGAVRRNQRAMSLLDGAGPTEHSIRWECRETGLPRRCRLDKWNQDLQFIVDIKTARDVSPKGFASAVLNCGYHRQAQFYRDGIEALTGERLPFVFVAVQNAPPYAVQCYDLAETFAVLGLDEVRAGLRRLAACCDSGTWDDPASNEIVTLSEPNWAHSESMWSLPENINGDQSDEYRVNG